MICPYAVSRYSVVQTSYEYDEEGKCQVVTTIDSNNASFIQCHKEDCAAYHNGKCCYSQKD